MKPIMHEVSGSAWLDDIIESKLNASFGKVKGDISELKKRQEKGETELAAFKSEIKGEMKEFRTENKSMLDAILGRLSVGEHTPSSPEIVQMLLRSFSMKTWFEYYSTRPVRGPNRENRSSLILQTHAYWCDDPACASIPCPLPPSFSRQLDYVGAAEGEPIPSMIKWILPADSLC